MLSIYGSKARIIQAHMSPEQQRLQVRYSEFFDFHDLRKEWLDIFVRWFLNEPLGMLPCELSSFEHPESSVRRLRNKTYKRACTCCTALKSTLFRVVLLFRNGIGTVSAQGHVMP